MIKVFVIIVVLSGCGQADIYKRHMYIGDIVLPLRNQSYEYNIEILNNGNYALELHKPKDINSTIPIPESILSECKKKYPVINDITKTEEVLIDDGHGKMRANPVALHQIAEITKQRNLQKSCVRSYVLGKFNWEVKSSGGRLLKNGELRKSSDATANTIVLGYINNLEAGNKINLLFNAPIQNVTGMKSIKYEIWLRKTKRPIE